MPSFSVLPLDYRNLSRLKRKLQTIKILLLNLDKCINLLNLCVRKPKVGWTWSSAAMDEGVWGHG